MNIDARMNFFAGGSLDGGGSGGGSSKGQNVCPSDRQLALRAKLRTGWSTGKPTATLDPAEREAILDVIRRNEQLEVAERQRVGKLVERVEKIKERAAECGPRNCRLCGQGFGLLGPSKIICDDCRKPVCSKCSIELHLKSGPNLRDIWLCKICSETREMWKKTGAWFFKGIPKYELPQRVPTSRSSMRELRSRPERTPKMCMKVDDSSSDDDDDIAGYNRNSFCRSYASPGKAHESMFLNRFESLRIQSAAASSAPNVGGDHDTLVYRKLSPLSMFSRQTSSSCDTNTTNASNDWDMESATGYNNTQAKRENGIGPANATSLVRCGSVSSSYSMSETSSANSSILCSTVGANQICREPPLGWLELSLLYSEADHTLDCSLLRARDLPAMDIATLADPYCKLNIITEYGTPKQKKWTQTKTVHKTRSPEFNETVRFFGVEPEELSMSTLYVVILDEDKYGSDFLGTAKIQLGPIYSPGAHRMSVPLCSEDQYCIEASSAGHAYGSILLGLSYNTKKRSLVVHIKRCANLMAKDNNGFSDPFVKLQIKPDSHRNKKQKTNVKWRNLNPIFNEEFSFETRPNELDKQSLIITVWDKDIGKSNDFLGSLVIGYNSKGRRLKQWKDCIRLPDCVHEQWHYLSDDQHPH